MFKREIFKNVQQKLFPTYITQYGEGFILPYYMTMKDFKESIISVQWIGPCLNDQWYGCTMKVD